MSTLGRGTLVVNDGVYINKKDASSDRFAKGLVRKDFVYEPSINKQLIKNNQKSFEVKINCTHRMSIYRSEISYDTKIIFSKETQFYRVAGKNYLKDIKEFICPFAGSSESSKVRKRLIALEKIYSTISNRQINFAITDR
jgi:hypothetical protein